MDYLNDLFIGGVAIAPLVVGLVALLKRFGLPDKYAPWANGAIAAGLWLVAVYLIPMYPGAAEFARYVATVVVIFLSASGIYQFGKITK